MATFSSPGSNSYYAYNYNTNDTSDSFAPTRKKPRTVLEKRLEKYGFYIPQVFHERQLEVMKSFIFEVRVNDIVYASDSIGINEATELLRHFDVEGEFVGRVKDSPLSKIKMIKITKSPFGKRKSKSVKVKFDINELVI